MFLVRRRCRQPVKEEWAHRALGVGDADPAPPLESIVGAPWTEIIDQRQGDGNRSHVSMSEGSWQRDGRTTPRHGPFPSLTAAAAAARTWFRAPARPLWPVPSRRFPLLYCRLPRPKTHCRAPIDSSSRATSSGRRARPAGLPLCDGLKEERLQRPWWLIQPWGLPTWCTGTVPLSQTARLALAPRLTRRELQPRERRRHSGDGRPHSCWWVISSPSSKPARNILTWPSRGG